MSSHYVFSAGTTTRTEFQRLLAPARFDCMAEKFGLVAMDFGCIVRKLRLVTMDFGVEKFGLAAMDFGCTVRNSGLVAFDFCFISQRLTNTAKIYA